MNRNANYTQHAHKDNKYKLPYWIYIGTNFQSSYVKILRLRRFK